MSDTEIDGHVRCIVFGAGEMGQAHIKALTALLPGRVAAWAPTERNRALVEEAGAVFYHGSEPEDALAAFSPTHAVVAAPVENLPQLTTRLIDAGLRDILVEKPAALDVATGHRLLELSVEKDVYLAVAYNRRFYASVRTARAMMIESDEVITSVWFEFTEWPHVIAGLTNQSVLTKERWLLANSMHVIDAALHAVGLPAKGDALFVRGGSLDWHPAGAIFAGAGRAGNGAPFACCANWDAPGRWGFEWLTPSTKYIFRPLEKLHVMRRGSVAIEEVPLLDDLDQQFKPGVYLQDRAFLTRDSEYLPNLQEAIDLMNLASRMACYPES